MADFVACLAMHTRDRIYGGGAPDPHIAREQAYGMHDKELVKGWDGDAAAFWVCAYANRQWSLSGDVTDDPSETPFHKAISISKGTIALLDSGGVYFSRIWVRRPNPNPNPNLHLRSNLERDGSDGVPAQCCYEIYQSLRGEASREAAAHHGEPYTFDVYTAHSEPIERTYSDKRHEGGPVGLVDGIAQADLAPKQERTKVGDDAWADSMATTHKTDREKVFPPSLVLAAFRTCVEDGNASVASDQTHILNAICGHADLNAPRTKGEKHAAFDETNQTLRGRFAGTALRQAVGAGGELLDACLEALREAKGLKSLVVYFGEDGASEEVMERVQAALPDCLETLVLSGSWCLRSIDRLSELVNLKELHLRMLPKLDKLPDLSRLTKLTSLKLNEIEAKHLPDLSTLVELRTLNLQETEFREFPGIEKLAKLETLDLPDGLANPPDVSMLTNLKNVGQTEFAYESDCD